jgi:AcrR family transcriptional regulator
VTTPARAKDDPIHPTRKALLQAAIRYMRKEGELPSFGEVAEAAKIPRRTAYRYFNTVEELATAATLEVLRPEMNRLMAAGFASLDPAERMTATVKNLVKLAAGNERVFRAMIRLTIAHRGGRGANRLTWFRIALEPLRADLGDVRFERLVRTFALAIGFEGLIAFSDMVKTNPKEMTEIVSWLAQTIVTQFLAESKPSKTKQRSLAARARI